MKRAGAREANERRQREYGDMIPITVEIAHSLQRVCCHRIISHPNSGWSLERRTVGERGPVFCSRCANTPAQTRWSAFVRLVAPSTFVIRFEHSRALLIGVYGIKEALRSGLLTRGCCHGVPSSLRVQNFSSRLPVGFPSVFGLQTVPALKSSMRPMAILLVISGSGLSNWKATGIPAELI
jgi:hypothetical protein